jgi:hypothetical protein
VLALPPSLNTHLRKPKKINKKAPRRARKSKKKELTFLGHTNSKGFYVWIILELILRALREAQLSIKGLQSNSSLLHFSSLKLLLIGHLVRISLTKCSLSLS